MFRLFQRASGLAVAPPPTHRPRRSRRAQRLSQQATVRPVSVSKAVAVPVGPLAARPIDVPPAMAVAPARLAPPWVEPALPPFVVVETQPWPPGAWWREDVRARMRAESVLSAVARSIEPTARPVPTAARPRVSTATPPSRIDRRNEDRPRRGTFARLALLVASVVVSFIVIEAIADRPRR